MTPFFRRYDCRGYSRARRPLIAISLCEIYYARWSGSFFSRLLLQTRGTIRKYPDIVISPDSFRPLSASALSSFRSVTVIYRRSYRIYRPHFPHARRPLSTRSPGGCSHLCRRVFAARLTGKKKRLNGRARRGDRVRKFRCRRARARTIAVWLLARSELS